MVCSFLVVRNIHRLQETPFGIVANERLCLLMIDLETLMNRLGSIILALNQFPAAIVADTFHSGRDRFHIEAGTTGLADPAAAHAAQDLIFGDLKGDGRIDLDAGFLHGLCLTDGAGHTVKDVALRTIVTSDTLIQDSDDDFIRHQLAGVDITLSLDAGGSAILDGGTEDIAGGDTRNTEPLAEDLRLRPLSGTGSA